MVKIMIKSSHQILQFWNIRRCLVIYDDLWWFFPLCHNLMVIQWWFFHNLLRSSWFPGSFAMLPAASSLAPAQHWRPVPAAWLALAPQPAQQAPAAQAQAPRWAGNGRRSRSQRAVWQPLSDPNDLDKFNMEPWRTTIGFKSPVAAI